MCALVLLSASASDVKKCQFTQMALILHHVVQLLAGGEEDIGCRDRSERVIAPVQ